MENKKFSTEIYNIQKLENRRFIIPSYQRPYVWGDEQINKFLSDFYESYSRNDKYYYIGTVLLKEQEQNLFQLIDGQQRFTTLWLIAVAFRIIQSKSETKSFVENFLKVGDELRIDFAIRKQIKAYLLVLMEKQVDEKNQYSDDEIKKDDYLVHIAEVITIVTGKIKSLTFGKGQNLQGFGNYIYQNIHFVVNTVPQNTDLNKLFSTINNSGVQLEQHDILKSLLLKKITTEKTIYSRIWEACENMNNYFEHNVKQLFPQEFDWTAIQYDDLKEFKITKHEKTKEENGYALTIADILQKENKCNLKIDLRENTTIIRNLSLSEISKISGKFSGDWINNIDAQYCLFNEDKFQVQFQIWDGDYIKSVEIKLTQNNKDIDIEFIRAFNTKPKGKHKELLGKDLNMYSNIFEEDPIANKDKHNKGYGISEIIINPETENNIDKTNTLQCNKDEESNVDCRSIIKFPQLLLHAYRIFLKQQEKSDFDLLPFHSKNLLQIFKSLSDENNQDVIKKFFKCLWTVRFVFDTYVIKWRQIIDDDKDEELLLTSISKSENTFSRTNKTEPSEVSMLQNMLYFTGNYNTQIWLTPYLKRLIDGEDALTCLENIDNNLSLNTLSEREKVKEASFELMNNSKKIGNISKISDYLKQSNGTSFHHYWFQKLEYILWKELNANKRNMSDNDRKKFEKYRITSKNSVEHVFPQDQEYGEKISDNALNSFGNLALLNVSQNSSYSNQTIVKKKDDFDRKDSYDSLKLKCIYESPSIKNWSEEQIIEHKDKMIEKIKRYYSK